MWQYFIILLIKFVNSDQFIESSLSVVDRCIDVCKQDQLSLLKSKEQFICQRGCRFFNIIHFKDDYTLNDTKEECFKACNESYASVPDKEVCQSGCNLMLQKLERTLTIILITDDTEANNIVLSEPDIDNIEADVFSDPSIKSQLEIGFDIDYKIPETRIRTMPIEFDDDAVIIQDQSGGDWLNCASKHSGLPRWFLLLTILFVILTALSLIFFIECHHQDAIDQKHLLDEDDEQKQQDDCPDLLDHCKYLEYKNENEKENLII